MTSKSLSDNDKPIGVIGAGNFGSVVANLLARQKKVLLYARDENVVRQIVNTRINRGHVIHSNVTPTDDLGFLARECDVIFPIIPSEHFRSLLKQLSPHLHPYHILIHGTKGST
jgi:glycerol-3-phosphate dehydrogenase (NAD(P)+)